MDIDIHFDKWNSGGSKGVLVMSVPVHWNPDLEIEYIVKKCLPSFSFKSQSKESEIWFWMAPVGRIQFGSSH